MSADRFGRVSELASFLPANLRLGPVFWRWRRLIDRSETQSAEFWTGDQARRLRGLLYFARQTVPFYRRRIGSDPTRLSDRDVFRLLWEVPPLGKDDLREHFEELWSTAIPKWRRRVVTTGGSTGAPVAFGIERGTALAEWAFITSIWSRIGFRVGDRRLMVRGLALKGQVIRTRHLLDELQVSAFHLSEEHLRPVWPDIQGFGPPFLHGYPSALTAFTSWDEKAVRSLAVRGILCASEALLPWQRSYLTETLGAPISHWYGHSERLVLGGECSHRTAFHMFPQYGFVETIDPDGGMCEDRPGEIVGTGFVSRAMPLIRYRTGDMGTLHRATTPCRCGRTYPLLTDVQGRWRQEFLVGRTNAPISPAAINFHDDSLVGVTGLQFVQESPGSTELRLTAGSALRPEVVERIHRALVAKVAGELDVQIRQVDRLEVLPSGKTPLIMQRAALPNPVLQRLADEHA